MSLNNSSKTERYEIEESTKYSYLLVTWYAGRMAWWWCQKLSWSQRGSGYSRPPYEVRRLLVMLSRAVAIMCCVQNPDRNGSSRLLKVRWTLWCNNMLHKFWHKGEVWHGSEVVGDVWVYNRFLQSQLRVRVQGIWPHLRVEFMVLERVCTQGEGRSQQDWKWQGSDIGNSFHTQYYAGNIHEGYRGELGKGLIRYKARVKFQEIGYGDQVVV